MGALAEVKEAEPNNDFAQPQKINLDSTVNGVVENEDVDYFGVEAKKGERITAELEGLRLGLTHGVEFPEPSYYTLEKAMARCFGGAVDIESIAR